MSQSRGLLYRHAVPQHKVNSSVRVRCQLPACDGSRSAISLRSKFSRYSEIAVGPHKSAQCLRACLLFHPSPGFSISRVRSLCIRRMPRKILKDVTYSPKLLCVSSKVGSPLVRAHIYGKRMPQASVLRRLAPLPEIQRISRRVRWRGSALRFREPWLYGRRHARPRARSLPECVRSCRS